MIRWHALVVATAGVIGSTPAMAGSVEGSPSAEEWNAIVAVGPSGEVTVVHGSGGVEELDRLVDATRDTSYAIAHAHRARVVAADVGGSGRLAVIEAASGETHHFDGYGGADPVPGSSQLVRRIRLRTSSPVADSFDRSIGFEAINEQDATHAAAL